MSKERLIYDPTAGPGIEGVCGNCLNGGHHICDRENCKCKANGHKAWWWVPESNKIELRVKSNQLHVGIATNGSVVLEDRMSDPHSDGLISTIYATVFHPSGHAHELGIQLSKSYNSTYGQNIAPEAVKDMYDIISDLCECIANFSRGVSGCHVPNEIINRAIKARIDATIK